MSELVGRLKTALDNNDGKIPFEFIKDEVEHHNEEVIFHQLTPNMRVCVIRLKSGHEVLGVAQVLDAKNDEEEIGNQVAYGNAINELWKTFGSIAKVI